VFADFHLSPEQEAALEAHLELLMRWNRTVNLTAIRTREEAIERHYGESLFLCSRLPPGRLSIADVGSGAGFPGFPVAVLRPDCSVTLIESHQRKSVFLREAARKLPNIRVLAKRAEDIREGFNWVISRAVGYRELGSFLKYLAPNAALLTGVEAPPPELGFVWDAPIGLPGSDSRFLRIGHVSRETSSR
jgi:16S rRNA (guanine(527)-N(7))-methyltransferase RsmG